MRLYFDCATSRFFRNKRSGEEPRVVRLAWWKDNSPDPVVRLIRPAAGMTIDAATVPYHHLTVERLERDGVDPAGVIAELEDAARDVRTVVSFNMDYHWRSLHRLMGQVGAPLPTTAACAMKLAEPILAIPAMRPGGGLKNPNLRECCERFGIPVPSSDDPVDFACQTVSAVRLVYEAVVAEVDKP